MSEFDGKRRAGFSGLVMGERGGGVMVILALILRGGSPDQAGWNLDVAEREEDRDLLNE